MQGEKELVRNTIKANVQKISEMETELSKLRGSIVEREKELACHMLLSHILDNSTQTVVASTIDNSHTWRALSEIIALLPPAWFIFLLSLVLTSQQAIPRCLLCSTCMGQPCHHHFKF